MYFGLNLSEKLDIPIKKCNSQGIENLSETFTEVDTKICFWISKNLKNLKMRKVFMKSCFLLLFVLTLYSWWQNQTPDDKIRNTPWFLTVRQSLIYKKKN